MDPAVLTDVTVKVGWVRLGKRKTKRSIYFLGNMCVAVDHVMVSSAWQRLGNEDWRSSTDFGLSLWVKETTRPTDSLNLIHVHGNTTQAF